MKRIILVLLVVLSLPVPVLAQAETTGRITGVVLDESGRPLAGARVAFLSSALAGERVVTTSAEGRFLAALLPVGPYAVTVTAPGHQPVQLSLRLGVGQTVPLRVVLKPGEETVDEVTVLGVQDELQTTVLGENFDYDGLVEELPIQGRDLDDVALYAPNVVAGPSPNTVAIAGAPSFDTVVLLDGAEISDPYFGAQPILYLEDAVEEVQVLTSGISARYGRFQGGVINAVTKSGGNAFDGTVRAEFDNERWNSRTPFGEAQADELNQTYQGTLGGYILRDRLWFFGGVRTIPAEDDAQTTLFTRQSFVNTAEEDRWQLKVRGAVTPDHVLEASHLDFDRSQSGVDQLGNCADLRCAEGRREDPRELNTFTYQGVLTPNLFLEVEGTEKNVSILAGGTPELGSPLLDFVNFQLFGNSWFDAADPDLRDNETASANLLQTFHTDRWGAHTLEYGVQYVNSTTGGENRQSSTGLNLLDVSGAFAVPGSETDPRFNLFSGAAFRFKALPFPGSPAADVRSAALYVQETWEVNPRWRLDAGVRIEDWRSKGPLPTDNVDFRDAAPRLGVTYNISTDWQVQAAFGKYISRLNDSFTNEATGVSAAPRSFDLYLGPDVVSGTYDDVEAALQNDAFWLPLSIFSPEFATTVLDPDLESPYANDFNLSVKRALPRNSGTLTFTYTNRKFRNLIEDFQGGFGFSETPNPLDPANPIVVDTVLLANTSKARREYEAVTATLDWRPSRRWNLGGNWTFSETLGNYEGEASFQPASGSPIGDFEASRPEEAAAPFGPLSGDIRHRVNLWGNLRFPFGGAGQLTLGGIGRYQSGSPYSLTAQVPLTDLPQFLGDAGNTFTYFFGGRGTRRFHGFWSLDLAARYQFPIHRELNGWVKLNVVNVLDNDELISFNTAGTFREDGGVPVTDPAVQPDANGDGIIDGTGVLRFQPTGNCGLGDPPSKDCTGFGRIQSENNYQTPRTYLLTVGLQF